MGFPKHLISREHLRADDFEAYFATRCEVLCKLVENDIGKTVERDINRGTAEEDSTQFEPNELCDNTTTESD